VPTTISGVVLFVYLLIPGLCYVARLERGQRPGTSNTISALRETATIVVASVLALSAASGVFAALRMAFARHTPDVGKLVTHTRYRYIDAHYAYLATWAIGILLLASAIAFATANFDLAQKLQDRFGDPKGGKGESAWWTLFEVKVGDARTRSRYLTCRLSNEAEIEGVLSSYSHALDEDDNRSLVIVGPYFIREDGAERKVDTGAITVSARDIIWLRVQYLTDTECAVLTDRTPMAIPSGWFSGRPQR
jgi:hypothetical protein